MAGIWSQACDTAVGVAALVRHAVVADDVESSIAAFEGDAVEVSRGAPTGYRVTLAHRGPRPRWAVLTIDFHSVRDPSPAGRHASVRTPVLLPVRESSTVEIHYDWRETAALAIDGVPLDDAALERGGCDEPGAYFVSAALSSRDGAAIERQTIRQRLSK